MISDSAAPAIPYCSNHSAQAGHAVHAGFEEPAARPSLPWRRGASVFVVTSAEGAASPRNIAVMLARSLPVRITSGDPRAPSASPSASIIIDLPEPVSPESKLRPG